MSHLAAVNRPASCLWGPYTHTQSAVKTTQYNVDDSFVDIVCLASLDIAPASALRGPTYSGSPINLYELSLGLDSGSGGWTIFRNMENLSSICPAPSPSWASSPAAAPR